MLVDAQTWRKLLAMAVLSASSGACSSGGTTSTGPGIIADSTVPTDRRGGGDAGTDQLDIGGDDVPAFDGRILYDGLSQCQEPPFGVGCPCEQNGDCQGGYCVEGPFGFMCTYECFDDCPEDWQK
ncbi:MAG: hypothetical protein FJ109_11280, partial [Deltaproteobacteria bacterium]|nr:hypothetical protein [Deltaproteobacteria bacterium]